MIYAYVKTDNISSETSIINDYVQANNILLNGIITDDTSALEAINGLQLGDTIIAVGIYSFVEKLEEIQAVIELCCQKKIYIKTIEDKFSIDETFDFDQLSKALKLAFDIRTSIMSHFTKVKLSARKDRGYKLGRPNGSINAKRNIDIYKDKILNLLSQGVSVVNIAKECGLSRRTIHKFIKELDLYSKINNVR